MSWCALSVGRYWAELSKLVSDRLPLLQVLIGVLALVRGGSLVGSGVQTDLSTATASSKTTTSSCMRATSTESSPIVLSIALLG